MKNFFIVMLMGILFSTSALARPHYNNGGSFRPQWPHHERQVVVKHHKEKPVYGLVAGIVGAVIGGYIVANRQVTQPTVQYTVPVQQYTGSVNYVQNQTENVTCTTTVVNGMQTHSCVSNPVVTGNIVYF